MKEVFYFVPMWTQSNMTIENKRYTVTRETASHCYVDIWWMEFGLNKYRCVTKWKWKEFLDRALKNNAKLIHRLQIIWMRMAKNGWGGWDRWDKAHKYVKECFDRFGIEY